MTPNRMPQAKPAWSRRLEMNIKRVHAVRCPHCDAAPGSRCIYTRQARKTYEPHTMRRLWLERIRVLAREYDDRLAAAGETPLVRHRLVTLYVDRLREDVPDIRWGARGGRRE